jgi:hypothetical protein
MVGRFKGSCTAGKKGQCAGTHTRQAWHSLYLQQHERIPNPCPTVFSPGTPGTQFRHRYRKEIYNLKNALVTWQTGRIGEKKRYNCRYAHGSSFFQAYGMSSTAQMPRRR